MVPYDPYRQHHIGVPYSVPRKFQELGSSPFAFWDLAFRKSREIFSEIWDFGYCVVSAFYATNLKLGYTALGLAIFSSLRAYFKAREVFMCDCNKEAQESSKSYGGAIPGGLYGPKTTLADFAKPAAKDRDLMFECLEYADEICIGVPEGEVLAFAKQIYEWVK